MMTPKPTKKELERREAYKKGWNDGYLVGKREVRDDMENRIKIALGLKEEDND